MTDQSFFAIAFRRDVRNRAIRVALIVGLILGFINHGDKIILHAMDNVMWMKFILTFIVPFCVSIWSSVMALRNVKP